MNGSDQNPMTLPGRETVEVYISEKGFICIKQDDAIDPMGDASVILLLPQDIPHIVKWLNKCAAELAESN